MPQPMDDPLCDVDEIDLREVFHKLRKHRQTIISAVGVAVVAALIHSSVATPIFKAASRILIDTKRPKITKVDDQILPEYTAGISFFNTFFNSQIEILKSHTIAEMVFRDLGGYEPWKRRGQPAAKLEAMTDEERMESLLKQIKITPVRMTQVISVEAEDPDPALAAKIANAWTQAYALFSSTDELVQRKSELEEDLTQHLKYLKDKHPVILGLRSEMEMINHKIDFERARIRQAGDSSSLPADITNVKILDRAQVPLKPIRPRKARNAALALVLGIFLGGALALMFESLDQTIRTPSVIEHVLKVPSLVVLPRYELEKAHPDLTPEFLSFSARHSTVAEAFRSLRTGIVFSNPDLPKKTFVITSSSPAEGKTMVAINLATIFAQSGDRVVLVDTDLRHPRLHSAFHMERENGITNAIAHDIQDLATVIRKTEIPGLDIVTCGEIPPNPSEMLGSKKMGEMIHRLSSMYDRIVFDTPPVLAATDAVVLSTQVDATLLVIKAGDVHRQAAMRTVEALRSVRARLIGGILNMADAADLGGYYYYYIYGDHAQKNALGRKNKGFSKKRASGKKSA